MGQVLEEPEIEGFIRDGYLVVREAIPTELAEECRLSAAQQLGIDLASPNTWRRPVVRGVPTGECFKQAANAPRLLEAIAQLVEPDAWQARPNLGAFVVRFPSAEDPGDAGWHIDSSFQPTDESRWFVNYRSKGRALLLLCLVSDRGDGRRTQPALAWLSSRNVEAVGPRRRRRPTWCLRRPRVQNPASRIEGRRSVRNRFRWRRVHLSPLLGSRSQLASTG
jgi:hypothetical protein